MKQYISTIRDKVTSEYVRVAPSFDGAIVHVKATTARPTIVGTQVPMVKAHVRLTVPAPVTSCDPQACGGSVNESIVIEFNVKQGGDNFATLLAEAQRVLNVTVQDYQILNGLVPPVTATFSES